MNIYLITFYFILIKLKCFIKFNAEDILCVNAVIYYLINLNKMITDNQLGS